jgi:hypothetical protein
MLDCVDAEIIDMIGDHTLVTTLATGLSRFGHFV